MKLLDLFEYDAKIAQAFGKASSEIGQAGSKLKEPLVMTDVQGRVEQEIDKLEKSIAKDRSKPFDQIFQARLQDIKNKVGLPNQSLGLNLEVDRLTRNGKPNSGYIRRFLANFIKTLDKKIDSMSQDKTVKSIDRGRKVSI